MTTSRSLPMMSDRRNTGALAASTVMAPTPATFTMALNGAPPQQITVPDGNIPLLYILRNQFGLKGPRFGCGFGECGSCEALLLGNAGRTCQATIAKILALLVAYGVPPAYASSTPVSVVTLEGLGPNHPLPQAFITEQAGQCAFCANAMIIGSYGFLSGRYAAGNLSVPTTAEITNFLTNSTFTDPTTTPPTVHPSPYLCRCGAHLRIIAAIQAATPAVMARLQNGQI